MNGQKKSRARQLLVIILTTVAGASVGFLVAKHGVDSHFVRARLGVLNQWDLLSLPALCLLVLGAHELGHVLGGLRRGMRFLLLIVGPFQWGRGSDGIHFSWTYNLGTLGGVAACTPDPARPTLPQLRSLVLGGPLASLLFAILCFALAWMGEGRMHAYAMILGALSLIIFAVTATPIRGGGLMSDGMQFLELLRGGRGVEERSRLMTLMAQSLAGVRPAELDPEQIYQALAMVDPEPTHGVAARLYAFLHAWDGGDSAGAIEHADWLGEHIDNYPDGFRQSLAIELALFAALERGEREASRSWLECSSGGVVDASRRALAEAALAVLEQRTVAAEQHLSVAERALSRGMDPGLAKLSSDQIEILRSRLRELTKSGPRKRQQG